MTSGWRRCASCVRDFPTSWPCGWASDAEQAIRSGVGENSRRMHMEATPFPQGFCDTEDQPQGRVEMWRGGLGAAYLFTGPFVGRCLTSVTLLRFHIPLIKPDVQIYRIR